MPAPRPFTLAQARPIISKLVHPNRFQLLEKGSVCAVYLRDEPEAFAFGPTWEDVMEDLAKEKFVKDLSKT